MCLFFPPFIVNLLCIGWCIYKDCLATVILFKIWSGTETFVLPWISLQNVLHIKNCTIIKFKSWRHWEWKLLHNQTDAQKLSYLFPFPSKRVHQQYAVLPWCRRTRLSLSKLSLQIAWAEGCRLSQRKAGDHPICTPTWNTKQAVLPKVWTNCIALFIPPTVSPPYLKR